MNNMDFIDMIINAELNRKRNNNTTNEEQSKHDTVKNNSVKNDPVNHPAHYTYGSIETIDFIEDKKLNFALGNAIKYIVRAGHKDNALEDLQKAAWYINHEIEMLKKKR